MDGIVDAVSSAGGWRKSSFSEGQNTCVEVTHRVPGFVGIRDSKLGDASPILAVSKDRFSALLALIPHGH